MLHFHESLPANGSAARTFTLNAEVTGVLWNQPDATEPPPLVLLAHGGGQSAQAPSVRARAEQLIARGYDVVALDAPAHGGRPRSNAEDAALVRMREAMGNPEAAGNAVAAFGEELSRRAVPEWIQLLDDLEQTGRREAHTAVGFWGLSLGAVIGFALLSVETRVRAAVLGLVGDNLAGLAHAITTPIQFVLQWEDQLIGRDSALRLFDAIRSEDKTLHANPGDHHEVPQHEHASAMAFFDRHLNSVH